MPVKDQAEDIVTKLALSQREVKAAVAVTMGGLMLARTTVRVDVGPLFRNRNLILRDIQKMMKMSMLSAMIYMMLELYGDV